MRSAADSVSTHQLSARFLGEFSVSLGGEEIRSWQAGKARQLFQYLLLHSGHVVGSERLYEAVWPRSDGSAGSTSLKVAAHGLRRVLGAHPGADRESGVRIEYRNCGYVIQVADLWTDIAEFQNDVRRGLRDYQDGHQQRGAATLRNALSLYRDDFLVGEEADWVVGRREFFKSLMILALVTLRDESIRTGDLADLIELSQQILDLDRYHEESYRALIVAHGYRGELDRARAWYQLCRRRLRAELAVEPTAETTEAMRSAVNGQRRLAKHVGRSLSQSFAS